MHLNNIIIICVLSFMCFLFLAIVASSKPIYIAVFAYYFLFILFAINLFITGKSVNNQYRLLHSVRSVPTDHSAGFNRSTMY